MLIIRNLQPLKTFDNIPPSFSYALLKMSEPENAAEGMSAFIRISKFSHTQLCRLTKKYLSKTPSEFIKEVRLKYAWELVSDSDMSLVAVGEAVGYGSYSQFYTLF